MSDDKEKSIEVRKLELKERELALKEAELRIRRREAYRASQTRQDCQVTVKSQPRETDWSDGLVGGAIGLGIGSLFDDDC